VYIYIYIYTYYHETTQSYFFRKCRPEVKTRIHRGLPQYTKDFPASFLEIEVLLFHPIDCLSRSNTYPRFFFRHKTHLISPLLSRLPNILRCFYPASHVRASSWINIFISSKQDSVFARKFRKIRLKITKYRIYHNLINSGFCFYSLIINNREIKLLIENKQGNYFYIRGICFCEFTKIFTKIFHIY